MYEGHENREDAVSDVWKPRKNTKHPRHSGHHGVRPQHPAASLLYGRLQTASLQCTIVQTYIEPSRGSSNVAHKVVCVLEVHTTLKLDRGAARVQ